MRCVAALALLAACVSTKSSQLDATHSDQEQTFASRETRLDQRQESAIQAHSLVRSGPSEEVERWFGPDGGVVHEAERHWSGSTSETWLDAGFAGEEHLEEHADAGAERSSKDRLDSTEKEDLHPAASCAFGGGMWAIAVLAVAVLLGLRFLRR